MKYLESDEIEVFFKSFSMKDFFNKKIIEKYGLKEIELAKTLWFQKKMSFIIQFD
jgi:hypothetical protein